MLEEQGERPGQAEAIDWDVYVVNARARVCMGGREGERKREEKREM